MLFDLKKAVGGQPVVIILSFVYSNVAGVSIVFATVLVIAQVSCCLSVLQPNNIARINILTMVRQGLLPVVDDLPLVEIGGAVGLLLPVDCIRIRPS